MKGTLPARALPDLALPKPILLMGEAAPTPPPVLAIIHRPLLFTRTITRTVRL